MAETATVKPTEALAGIVDRVTFHNEGNGFCVLRAKARGQRDLITAHGPAPAPGRSPRQIPIHRSRQMVPSSASRSCRPICVGSIFCRTRGDARLSISLADSLKRIFVHSSMMSSRILHSYCVQRLIIEPVIPQAIMSITSSSCR